MRVSDSTIERVRQYQDIVSYINNHVSLKRRGRNYIGLCPFHGEKTPSFTVSPERHLWHCFGCHESGDLISFVQKIDNLTFLESIIRIAEAVGIAVEYEESGPNPFTDERDALRDIAIAYRDFCKASLVPGHFSYEYLMKRGLSPETLSAFQLGYNPKDFNVTEFCKIHHFQVAQFIKSGLVFKTNDGTFVSRFKHRLMFPIFDHLGKVSGFSGRLLEDDGKSAKYINSEENLLFNKRKLLYGLDKAKNAIKQRKNALIVEGYMDVLMCHQYGFTHTVGIMGTALTTEQAQLLKRFAETVYVALDSDTSGQQAIEKSYHVLRAAGLNVYVVKMALKDPADMLKDGDVEGFEALLTHAVPAIEFMFEQAVKRYGTEKIEMVSKILHEIRPLLVQEQDLIVRKHYVYLFSKRLGIDEELILVNNPTYFSSAVSNPSFNKLAKKSKFELAEEHLIFFMFMHVERRNQVSEVLEIEDFEKPEHRQLAEYLFQSNLENKELLESLENNTLRGILTQVIIHCDQFGISASDSKIWKECVDVIRTVKRDKRIDLLKKEVSRLELLENHEDQIGNLLKELQDLNFQKRGTSEW